MTKNATWMKKLNVLELVEQIVEMTSDEGLDIEMKRGKPRVISQSEPVLKELTERLGLDNQMETLMMSVFVDQCNDCRISLRDIARHFNVRPVKMLTMAKYIDSLVRKGIIMRKRQRDGDLTYRIPARTIECLRNDKLPEPERIDHLSAEELYSRIDRLLLQREEYEIRDDEMHRCMNELLESNPQLELTGRLRSFGLTDDDLTLFLVMCRLFINNQDNRIGRCDLEDFFEAYNLCRHMTQLNSGEHVLQKLKLVENSFVEGQVDPEHFQLTDYSKREVLSELKLKTGKDRRADLTHYEDITPKALYYNEGVTRQVEQLQNLLGKERMERVQKRLKDMGMRTGFVCLFYGAPGTGKTETAQQLARLTGRDIMLVDVPSIRSKWVGETEKNIKEVFDRYDRLAKESDMAPILLFNEADALLCKRSEGAVGSVDKMENAMQNIILQEMEKLQGIMIATTNLTGSLDPAFERRFLYKIEFEKPTPKESQHIWKAMLPELSDKDALELAKTYAFSGGQIENIARKQLINNVLADSEELDINAIHEACKQENMGKKQMRAVGF